VHDLKGTAGTIVLMGHSTSRANANYERIFAQYLSQGGDTIDSVVFIWGSQEDALPPYVKWLTGVRRETGAPHLVVLRARKNSLNNRYLVADFVRTEAVFVVDDDVLPSRSLVRCLLATWARAPERIVGLDLRRVGLSSKTQTDERKAMYVHVRHDARGAAPLTPPDGDGDAQLHNTVGRRRLPAVSTPGLPQR
jgi:hypothetical protein